mmetsp:Transcript_68143/g.76283  ORF Transcript_68143/g.76283 Transcript_68143/m.76283 type:complete len:529 (+) Transcript_68143:61-1647(+)
MTETPTQHNENNVLECDYLIIGAGATTLAFIDTLLTELPDTKIVLIDKKAAPGGHWIDSYPYVKLHQPSILYGIASKQLEGNWLKCLLTQFTLPWNHRANKTEILKYFADFVKEQDQIDFYPHSVYDFDNNNSEEDIYSFSSIDGSVSYKVKVNVKLVDGGSNECVVPHNSPLQFPVDDEVRVMTPNQVYDAHEENRNEMQRNKYVVLGAGKTGMDAVVYLQRTMNIDPVDIAWVISQDVWMTSKGSPKSHMRFLLKHDNDMQQAALEEEEKGGMVRLDKDIMPTVFRFPTVQLDELELMQKVKTMIRRGRATAIRRSTNSKGGVVVEFGSDHTPWEAFAPIDRCIFVHATSPGPFFRSSETSIFNSEKKMTLRLVFEPPITMSMSCLAKVEANRRKGTLDLEYMKLLVVAREGEGKPLSDSNRDYTENEMLDSLIQPWDFFISARPMLNLATLLAICDKDPLVPMNWMKQNRLAMLGSIPGFKCMVHKGIQKFRSKGDDGQKKVGLTAQDIRMLELLEVKIQPLEGM